MTGEMFGYNRAPGTSLGSLVITAVGLVIVGVPFYVLVLSKGFAGVAAMPAAIPIAAVALAIIVGIGHKLTGSGPQAARMPYRRGNPAAGIAVGLAMIVGGIFMSFKAGADVHRYDADTSCTAGFGGAPVAGHARSATSRSPKPTAAAVATAASA